MIGAETIRDILSLYKKHGWTISRVLLSKPLSGSLDAKVLSELFGTIEIEASEFDAVWFKRPRNDGRIAWEIRRLTDTPYALCESYAENTSSEDVLAGMRLMEDRLAEQSS